MYTDVTMAEILNPNYKLRNLVSFNLAGFACISLVVFLSSSQPFYLSDVIGISPNKVGKASGALGVVDEITAVVVAPLIGTLNDRINGYAGKSTKSPSGPRILELSSFFVLGLAFLGYGKVAHRFFPDLYLFRSLIAVGVSGIMSISVVMLHEANNSDLSLPSMKLFTRAHGRVDDADRSLLREDGIDLNVEHSSFSRKKKAHGKLSAALGVFTGLGAIFSVSVFLTMPVRLSEKYGMTSAKGLQLSYTILGCLAFVSGVAVFYLGYDCVRQRRLEYASVETETPDATYIELLSQALGVSRRNPKLHLAYIGAFVARSTTVVTSVFIPLMVYKYYFLTGACGNTTSRSNVPLKNDCHDGYIFSAILTGVSSTVSLISTPGWGILVDSNKFGNRAALLLASVFGILGSYGLCIAGGSSQVYDPRNAWCFVAVCLIGLAQIGVIIASMSLLSTAGQTLHDSEHRVIGGITGLYSLSGGLGILIIASVGGIWSDHWVFGPFFILGSFNVMLLALCVVLVRLAR